MIAIARDECDATVAVADDGCLRSTRSDACIQYQCMDMAIAKLHSWYSHHLAHQSTNISFQSDFGEIA